METLWRKFLHFFTSVRLTIVLLIFIAIACTCGTLLPQNQPLNTYEKQFGTLGTRLIDIFSLNDVYHARWFQFLLSFLAVNLIICSVDRFPRTWRLWRYEKKTVDKDFFKHLPLFERVICPTPLEEVKKQIVSFFKKEFSSLEISTNPIFALYGKKGSVSYWGPYIVHAGILIVLCGAIISSLFGFSGTMVIPEGEVSNTVFIHGKGHKMYNLPFSFKCEKFIIEYYPNGTPKEYISHLLVIDGKKKIRKILKVNSPLDYQGFRFYQASYGVSSHPTLTLFAIDRKTGEKFKIVAPFNQVVSLPNNKGSIRIIRAVSNLMNMGPAFQLIVTENGKSETTWLIENFPQFDSMHRKGNYALVLKDYTHYTGIQVKKDPGVWIVWTGCLVMIGGLFVGLFVIPQKLWLHVIPHPKGCEIFIGAMATKRRLLFKYTFQRWIKQIKEGLVCGT
ncbi:MAG TPA: cytochrome c biogenesis protein ResB [Candidatus Desulfofervidus auxilii]|uniref:Cytochrome c biogenesis protein ResB n=1 Tax=Desulfofervidus auxilii TaxID=1621989 RepID=A0A7V0NEI9_DESA2|nr:cytochrome c biogenesis protein ResB [Candidatus Desulfofervidus auxilii]